MMLGLLIAFVAYVVCQVTAPEHCLQNYPFLNRHIAATRGLYLQWRYPVETAWATSAVRSAWVVTSTYVAQIATHVQYPAMAITSGVQALTM